MPDLFTCRGLAPLRLVAIMHTEQGRGSHHLESWNVRSMVDTEGPVEIASSRGDRGKDREVDLFVREIRRYNVKVTALQEIKWLGNGCMKW